MPPMFRAHSMIVASTWVWLTLGCAQSGLFTDPASPPRDPLAGQVAGSIEQPGQDFAVVRLVALEPSAAQAEPTTPAPSLPSEISIGRHGQTPRLAFLRPFEPFVLHNTDAIHHEVFTAGSNHTFRVRLASGERTAPLRFQTAALVRGYCRMHPSESFTFLVGEASHHAYVEGGQRFEIDHVPAGRYEVRATGLDGPIGTADIEVAPGTTLEITLRPDPRMAK